MKCENCEVALICTDPARFGGGCDMDGSDDFGCGTDDEEEDSAQQGDFFDHMTSTTRDTP